MPAVVLILAPLRLGAGGGELLLGVPALQLEFCHELSYVFLQCFHFASLSISMLVLAKTQAHGIQCVEKIAVHRAWTDLVLQRAGVLVLVVYVDEVFHVLPGHPIPIVAPAA